MDGDPAPGVEPDVLDELARAVVEGRVTTRQELERLKRELASREGLARVPTDADVLGRIEGDVPEGARSLLLTKPSRSLSGVTVVAVMAPPAPCPHGRCAYCPGGVEAGTPQSYTGKEPAARRAARPRPTATARAAVPDRASGRGSAGGRTNGRSNGVDDIGEGLAEQFIDLNEAWEEPATWVSLMATPAWVERNNCSEIILDRLADLDRDPDTPIELRLARLLDEKDS